MAKKCTNIYNTNAQLFFCSLHLLLGDVLFAVVVMCQSSLIMSEAISVLLALDLFKLGSKVTTYYVIKIYVVTFIVTLMI